MALPCVSNTRKTLERVPADKWDWKPQAKSGSLGWLAGHIATLPTLATPTINLTELELARSSRPKVENRSQLLPVFAKCREEARKALEGVTDEQLRQTWT